MPDWLKDSLLVIISLGGLEVFLHWHEHRAYKADAARQLEQSDTLMALFQVTSELNDKTPDPPKLYDEKVARNHPDV